MKRIYNYLGGLLIVLLVFAACAKDIFRPSEGGIPLATDIDVDIVVDQEINQVTFTFNNKGAYPIWSFVEKSKTVYSTSSKFTKVYNAAGTYSVEIKLGNAHGISDGSIIKTFTIDNSLVDYDKYIGLIAGSGSKTWSIAKKEIAHLACGPSGTDGTEWWSAPPNDKADWGVYDDVLTFTSDMKYTYNPGEGGTVYVNKESSLFSAHNPHNELDFMAPVEEQTTTYSFVGEGEDVFLIFPAETLFPYIANDESYNAPKYRVVGISANKIELVSDNGSIAWHYILTTDVDTGEEEPQIGGYDPDSDCNLWKKATIINDFYYAPDWNSVGDPGFVANGNSYEITLPVATSLQWQAQVAYRTNMTTKASTNYDFSAVLNSSKDHNNVTVKLVKTGEDGTFFFEEKISLKAYENYIFTKADMPGIGMDQVSLVFDFGGNAAQTVVSVSRVVLKEHSCDDGTTVSGPDNADSDCNKWKSVKYTNFFYYAPGWNEVAAPEVVVNGNSYKVTLPEETFQQWQAQVHFKTDNISTSTANKYDFQCVLNATKDITGVTVKLTKVDDDETFYFTKNVNLKAYEDLVLKVPDMDGLDIDKVNLVFDFGGNPANTEVTISKIILKESMCNN